MIKLLYFETLLRLLLVFVLIHLFRCLRLLAESLCTRTCLRLFRAVLSLRFLGLEDDFCSVFGEFLCCETRELILNLFLRDLFEMLSGDGLCHDEGLNLIYLCKTFNLLNSCCQILILNHFIICIIQNWSMIFKKSELMYLLFYFQIEGAFWNFVIPLIL